MYIAGLFTREVQPAYVGVLGPQRRTREVLAEAAKLLGSSTHTQRAEEWLPFLHAPTGLDLGAETPAAIALSIIAEIQQTLNNGSALPLRQVRAVHPHQRSLTRLRLPLPSGALPAHPGTLPATRDAPSKPAL